MSDQLSTKLFCPHCGQKLLLPTVDLRRSFRCPRCQAEECAAELIPPQRTVAAVPIESVMVPAVAAARASVAESIALPPAAALFGDRSPPSAAVPAERSPVPAPAIQTGVDVNAGPRAPIALRFIRSVLHCAERFDAFSYGYRGLVIYVLAGLHTLLVLAGVIWELRVWERVALVVFFLVLGVYALARLALFRREDGRWTWRSAASGIRGIWDRSRDWYSDWRKLPPQARRASWTIFLLTGGLISTAIRGGAEWVFSPVDSIGFVVWAFAGWAAITVGLYRLYKYWSPRAPQPKALPAANALQAGTKGLPPVIDLVRHSEVSLQHLRAGVDDYLFSLLEVLARWDPRPRGEASELAYQDSLQRHLRRRAPDLRVERERPIDVVIEQTRRRLDLTIDERVVIELKRNLRRTADVDRMYSQLRSYAKAWPHGPVLLVICETAEEFAQHRDLHGKIESLRADGCAVVAIAAGRKAVA